MKPQNVLKGTCLIAGFLICLLVGCDNTALVEKPSNKPQRLEIGFNELMNNAEITATVTQRSHGYVAEAKGKGTIPSGEYAGEHFQISFSATYSALGLETLTDGQAVVKIRDERFESVADPLLYSFCCGEGHIQLIDDEYEFVVFGQVNHITATEPHNHLFAAFATTAGTMNMNIADQTGSVVEPADPPHDPGVGLIEGFDAQRVRVELH